MQTRITPPPTSRNSHDSTPIRIPESNRAEEIYHAIESLPAQAASSTTARPVQLKGGFIPGFGYISLAVTVTIR